MSNILKELKSEITRLARKEIKGELASPRKSVVVQRGLIADLRRQVNAMQKELNALKKAVPDKAILTKTEPEGRFWITGKGVKTMRKRMGLTQAVFGKLVGVSAVSVVKWEKINGKVDIRKKATMARLQEIKSKGKKEVAELLGLERERGARKKAKRGEREVKKGGADKMAKKVSSRRVKPRGGIR